MPNDKDSVTSVINERYEEHKLLTGCTVVNVCFIRVFLITQHFKMLLLLVKYCYSTSRVKGT